MVSLQAASDSARNGLGRTLDHDSSGGGLTVTS
jgi:hypothetical protein